MGDAAMIIRCSYCNKCLNDTEYKILSRKNKGKGKRRTVAIHTYNSKDSDIQELKTMKSGEKHQWLKLHRDEILEYLEENGDAETRRHYGINRLDILQNMEKWNIPYQKTMTKTEILESKIITLESEIKSLKKQIPQAISKLSPEDQVKLLTFQLSQAVSKLTGKSNSQELNISNMYKIDTNGKMAKLNNQE